EEKRALALRKAPAPTKNEDAIKAIPAEETSLARAAGELAPAEKQQEAMVRNVAPQRVLEDTARPALSQLTFATADFPALTYDSNEGVVTRFEQDRLDILFWLR